jgi:hypothetical protein
MGARATRGREASVDLTVDAGAAAAGQTISGEVSGPAADVTVALLRVEQSPAGTYAFSVESGRAKPVGDAARFQLNVPPRLPPAAAGDRCRLEYAVRATCRASRWSRRQAVEPVVIRAAERAVHESASRLDRVIPSQPARHFHLELVDALLEGGGHVSGRVHREGDAEDTAFLVTAMCEEAWCTNFRFRTRRSPLLWERRPLWSASDTVEVEDGGHWSPFRFDIPAGLPPAAECRVIAWRYTIEAQPAARRTFTDRAMLTPLRFEV